MLVDSMRVAALVDISCTTTLPTKECKYELFISIERTCSRVRFFYHKPVADYMVKLKISRNVSIGRNSKYYKNQSVGFSSDVIKITC